MSNIAQFRSGEASILPNAIALAYFDGTVEIAASRRCCIFGGFRLIQPFLSEQQPLRLAGRAYGLRLPALGIPRNSRGNRPHVGRHSVVIYIKQCSDKKVRARHFDPDQYFHPGDRQR